MFTNLTNWNELHQTSTANIKKFADIHKGLLLSLTQQQLDVVAIYMEGGVKHLQNLTEAKDMQTLLHAQTSLADELSKKLVGNFRTSVEMVADAKVQLTELAQNNSKEMCALFVAPEEVGQAATA